MWTWHLATIIIITTLTYVNVSSAKANILHSVLGFPSECVYNNVVRTCTLSFSCWIQGGRYAKGCGENKWLFSCCVPEADSTAAELMGSFGNPYYENEVPARFTVTKLHSKQTLPSLSQSSSTSVKQNMLRRRIDDDPIDIKCGIPRTIHNTLQKRIIGGRKAHFGEYPWQAHIRIAGYQCGGVLVSRHFIVTAAHCIEQARMKDIIVYLGEHDTQDSGAIEEPMPAEKHFVSRKFIHPKFKFRIAQPDRYDLALLQLATPTTYTNHILPICLPGKDIDLKGRRGIIAGWGKTDLSTGHTGTAILQMASVPIISTSECIDWHEKKNIFIELYEEMFCAGYSNGKQDACLGDSGGGLILVENGKYTLVGITSAGFGCGVDHQPGIYHNVQMTSKWIQGVINKFY